MEDFRTLMEQGIQHMNIGAFAPAESAFRAVLEQHPDYDDALQLLGLVRFRQGDAAEGERLIRGAISRNPQNIRARNNLAAMLRDLKRLEESSVELQQLYLLVPEDPHVCLNLAIVLNDLGRAEDAQRFAAEALALAPQWWHAHLVQALVFKQLGQFDKAFDSLGEALKLEPRNAECLSNLSAVHLECDDFVAAEKSARAALDLEPDRADAHHNLGVALARQQDNLAAIEHLERAIVIDPHNAKARCDLAATLCDQGEQDDLDRAMVLYREAQLIDPKLAIARFASGLLELAQGDFDDAMALYREAQSIDPHLAIARFGISLLQLTQGDYANGWVNYEARKTARELRPIAHPKIAPDWDGEDLQGKRILLYGEQGYGDILQFVRFVPGLAARGAVIDLQIPPELTSLIRESRWPVEFVSMTEAEHETYDFQSALLSLPKALRLDLPALPVASHYLRANPEKVAYWEHKFELGLELGLEPGKRKRPRIGLCWAGNPTFKNDYKRSIGADIFSRLCIGIEADFVNLQKDIYANELEEFAANGISLRDWSAEFFNFSETAALIDCLDLVISVDTVIAHLAAGLGRPTWTLVTHIPDWRWLLNRSDSPWYPSMRLFRQPTPGDWDSVIAQVGDALAEFVSAASS